MKRILKITNVPVIVKDEKGRFHSRFDFHNVEAKDKKYIRALLEMQYMSLDNSKWKAFNLKPGEAVIFENTRTLHTRQAFTPKFDGNYRWLLRVFGARRKPFDHELLHKNVCKHHIRVNF